MEAKFTDEGISTPLAGARIDQMLVFGALCCERMLPSYPAFVAEASWGDFAPVRRGLDAVWAVIEGGALSEDDRVAFLLACQACVPDSEEFHTTHTAAAQDAAFSVCFLLAFLFEKKLERVVTIARYATDTVDLIVQEQEDMDTSDPDREQMILEHPLMQQELERQRRDLNAVRELAPNDVDTIRALRARAQREPILELDVN